MVAMGIAALVAGCMGPCASCGGTVAPVRERIVGVDTSPGMARSYNPLFRSWERPWPYGPNINNRQYSW